MAVFLAFIHTVNKEIFLSIAICQKSIIIYNIDKFWKMGNKGTKIGDKLIKREIHDVCMGTFMHFSNFI